MSYNISGAQSAKMFSKFAHKGQKYGKDDYFEKHIEDVVHKVKTLLNTNLVKHDNYSICIMVAYLHDVIEDTDATYEDIYETFGWDVAKAVQCLTKSELYKHMKDYYNYIEEVKMNQYARIVKIADTLSNLEASIVINDEKRIKKYQNQLFDLM